MFRCEYCGRPYVKERAFLMHKCVPMERARVLETPIGMSAYQMYRSWLGARRHLAPSVDTFKESTQFNAFIRFAEFVKATKLNLPIYIDLMVKYDLPPDQWTRDDAYSKYIEYIDKTLPPKDHIKMSVGYVVKMADAVDCDTGEVFDFLTPNEVGQLIRDRKLSPWLLLHSRQFKLWLIRQTEDDQLRLQELIRPVYWKMRFERDPSAVEYSKKVVQAMGL